MKNLKPIHLKGLTCPRCGKKGETVKIPFTIDISRGPLDFPSYRCEDCGMIWYDGYDVISLIVHYSYEFVGPRKEQVVTP
jgi:hypothetical protein